jgi:hypothetical protein
MMKKLIIGLVALSCQQAMASSSPSAVAELAALDVALPALIDISTTHPVFDFDGDGCLPSAGIGREGQQNQGLDTGGGIAENCRKSDFLKTSNTLHRYVCTTVSTDEFCSHYYALYFIKDQTVDGLGGGHKNDWENAAVWTKNGNVTHGSYSAHGNLYTKPVNELPLEQGHLKIVYHKDGGLTHALRFAKSNEYAENPYGAFVVPPITSWYTLTGDNVSNQAMREKLNTYNYGSASIAMKNSNFLNTVNSDRPSGYPQFTQQDVDSSL